MSAIDLISLLDGVRTTGPDKWVARCPAHEDKTASLSIARSDDRWLIHCFAGCYPVDVMAALGLELAGLFDDRKYQARGDRVKPRLSAMERLELLEHETTIAWVLACNFARDGEISQDNIARLAQAANRIGGARYAR